MFQEDVAAIGKIAVKKINLMKERPGAYFILSMLAGIYVGIGILLICTIGGLLSESGYSGAKILMGASFPIALSLVLMAGSELFTGNNMTMAIGLYTRDVILGDVLKLWGFCWFGNLVGSLLLAMLYLQSGLGDGVVGEYMAKASLAKISPSAIQLIARGILCNLLVCLGVWCTYRMKSESGKLMMIFWCIYGFITMSFEHSVANMTLLAIGGLNPSGYEITWTGVAHNLLFVTLGNMIGGIVMVGLPYALVAGGRKTDTTE